MNINYENVKAAYYRGQNILKIYSGSTLEWEYETEPMEQTTKQIWYNSVSGDVVEPYAASAMGTVVSNTAYETKCVLEFASDVTAIGANAFSGCTDLEYVSLPVSAISIGDNAFDGCSSLDDIYMPSVQSIGRESFKDCAFTAFTVPTSVTAITADAFKGVAIEEFNYNGTKAQWSGITYGDFWDEDTWITNVIHCSDGDIELYPHDYSKDYFTIEATKDGEIGLYPQYRSSNLPFYSLDNGKTWNELTSGGKTLNNGDKILLKATITIGSESYPPLNIKGIGITTFIAYGNIMSLLYGDNFKNQTSLNGKSYCFNKMFSGSSQYLTSVENLILPATSLTEGCYKNMFRGCTSLTTAPQLPATTLASSCYANMFNGCTSLTTALVVSATTMATSACTSMFEGCTSLVQAPSLPVTTMATYCYSNMFKSCTSLTTAPELPATTLAQGCYESMFRGCTSLTTAPQLQATTLAQGCYGYMFLGCNNLTQAPVLSASTLVNTCYSAMFSYCSKLNYIKMLATNISATRCLEYWVDGVAETGTFVKAASMTSLPTGANGIPNGWTVEDFPPNYLRFVAKSGGTFNFSGTTTANTISYSTDSGDTWSTPAQVVSVNVNSGDTVLWKGEMNPISDVGIGTFSASTATFDTEGNVMSLLYGDNYKNQTSLSGKSYAFYRLFKFTKMGSAENIELPATTLSERCYSQMFADCTSLTIAPSVLSATTLASYCYGNMFGGCSSLTTPPELPTTTLASNCYDGMFVACGNLRTAPELLATTLANQCYKDMFRGCSKLNYIKMLATDISASSCLDNWVMSVQTSSGTFIKAASMTSLTRGNSGIPNGWTVEDYTPPHDYSQDYFTIEIKEDGYISINTMPYTDENGDSRFFEFEYSKDNGSTWITPTMTEDDGDCYTTFNVYSGDSIMFRCDMISVANENMVGENYKPMKFGGYGVQCDFQGNIMSLVYGDNFTGKTSMTDSNVGYSFNFSDMFGYNNVVDASKLVLPATTLTADCYSTMFQGCESLETAPTLPATTLAERCYDYMFAYSPKLNYIKMLATNISASNCLRGWVDGVAATGTFVKSASATIPSGTSGIPNGWTVETA